MTPPKRFLVRTALVTGSTIATIVGAQSLAMLDSKQLETIVSTLPTLVPTQTQATEVAASVVNAAPAIIILRHPAQAATAIVTAPIVRRQSALAAAIQPPAPVVADAPAPVIIQAQSAVSAPSQPVTRSSR
jgi:hypothetical protein